MTQRRLALLALALALAGCSKPDPHRILGHWQAERVMFQGLGLPIGPELEISASELRLVGSGAVLPIQRIEAKDELVTLSLPASVSLSFHFEAPDHMYLDAPLIGRVDYHRLQTVPAAAKPAQAPQPAPSQAAAPLRAPVSAAVPAPVKAASTSTSPAQAHGAQAYQSAVEQARAGDADGAIRSLHAAFQQGFREWRTLDNEAAFSTLRRDVRYEALMSAWRTP